MQILTERVSVDQAGRPVVGGCIPVQTILERLAAGDNTENIVNAYPILDEQDILAAIDFTDKVVRGEIKIDFWRNDNMLQEPDSTNYTRILRIWKHIEINQKWRDCDTSILDDISDSWFDKRQKLPENTHEFSEFLTRLKREHAIETGIVERMYDISKGITETLIKEGFDSSLLSHGDANIPTTTLMKHLNDHLEAVDFVFDVVKEDRPLSVSFIKQIHQLVTRNQQWAEGRDQFGTKLKIPLIRGEFKSRENNPTRDDGTVIMYCPPEHVASEMDSLVEIYNQLVKENVHPLIISAWFHHSFTTIHPFQDGNGRVARLLASLIFIKFGFFPFTVLREDAKSKYIEGLEAADQGDPTPIVTYFANVQKRSLQNALNIKEVDSASLSEVQTVLVQKLKDAKKKAEEVYQRTLDDSRKRIYIFCSKELHTLTQGLEAKMSKWAEIILFECSFNDTRANEKGLKLSDYYFRQIVSYAKLHDYFFNRTLPKAWLALNIQISPEKRYRLVVTLHHYGYQDATLAIGAFLELKYLDDNDALDSVLPLPIPPHVISINGDVRLKEKNIKQFLENALTLAIGQIASEV